MNTTFLNGDDNLLNRGLKSIKTQAEFFTACMSADDLESVKVWGEEVNFFDYGLCFDFVEADEKTDGYYRYQIAWGGPSYEVRFHPDGTNEFVFLDWFEGVGFDVTYEDWAEWLREWFEGCEMINFDSIEPELVYSFNDYEEEE